LAFSIVRTSASSWLVCSSFTALVWSAACSSDTPARPAAPAPESGVVDASDGGIESAPEAAPDAELEADAASDAAADAPADAPADRTDARSPTLGETIQSGPAAVATRPRPAFGALLIATEGARSYVVESRRDVEPGPFGLPWRSRFRLAAYDRDTEVWSFAAEPDDVIGDVAVHPSGELTLSLLRHPPDSQAYELVRLTRDGAIIGRTPLPQPLTAPASDYGRDDPRPLFRMKADFADATAAGWVRLLADQEGLVVVFLSFVDAPPDDVRRIRMALGLMTLDWRTPAYVERWARVVEGMHAAQPAAWAYDELRWREQAIRPFLARDEASGDLLVGRAWNSSRCEANVAVFGEFTARDCMVGAVNPVENERLPLAVTRFDRTGARRGTRILAPDADAAEQVPFALAARDNQLAVAGSLVRALPDGSRRTYPDADGFVDYDGYVIVYDAEGRPLRHRDFNLGRGDVLAALRWTAQGIVAVGAAGWDRWQGGMSISRGADPLFAWLGPDGTEPVTRVIALSNGSRHFNLHDVAVVGDTVVGYGFSDAPMTHSGDGNKNAERTFGPLVVRLAPQ